VHAPRLEEAFTVALLAALLLIAAPSEAARARVAVHPLAVAEGTSAERAALESTLARALGARGLEVVWAPVGGCDGSTACLADIAKGARAPAALAVHVLLYPVVVSGQVVRADGREVPAPPVKRLQIERGQHLAAATGALEDWVRALPHSAFSAPQRFREPARADVGVSLSRWRHPAGWATGAFGALSLGAGGFFHFQAHQQNSRFASLLQEGPQDERGATELRLLQTSSAQAQLARNLLFGAGAAALVAGGVLVLGDEPDGSSARLSMTSLSLSVVGTF
jgi:hypothetical protein